MSASSNKITAFFSIVTFALLLSACTQTPAGNSQFTEMDYTYYLTGGNPPPYTRTIFSTTNF